MQDGESLCRSRGTLMNVELLQSSSTIHSRIRGMDDDLRFQYCQKAHQVLLEPWPFSFCCKTFQRNRNGAGLLHKINSFPGLEFGSEQGTYLQVVIKHPGST